MPGRLRRHDEFGHVHFLTVSCYRRLRFFRHDNVKLSFIRAMERVRNKHGIRWIGYVIMPEHVHLLLLPERASTSPALGKGGAPILPGKSSLLGEGGLPNSEELVPISRVLHDLKGFSGRWAKEALREVWRSRGTLGTSALDAWALGPLPTAVKCGAPSGRTSVSTGRHKPFRKPRGYDLNILDRRKVPEKLDYLHGNPVRRGLVDRPEDWPWSSFRYYEGGGDSLVAMDGDRVFSNC